MPCKGKWEWEHRYQSKGSTQQLHGFKNKLLQSQGRARSEHPEVSVPPLSPLPFRPHCDKPLCWKTIKMVMASQREAQPQTPSYELPTFPAHAHPSVAWPWREVPARGDPSALLTLHHTQPELKPTRGANSPGVQIHLGCKSTRSSTLRAPLEVSLPLRLSLCPEFSPRAKSTPPTAQKPGSDPFCHQLSSLF